LQAECDALKAENERLELMVESSTLKLAKCDEALEAALKALASGYSPHHDAGQEVYNTARRLVLEARKALEGK